MAGRRTPRNFARKRPIRTLNLQMSLGADSSAEAVEQGGQDRIAVSHRFSTVRRADRIVVVADGRVVEDGSHDALMRAAGRYARLFDLQANRFRDEPGTAEESESR